MSNPVHILFLCIENSNRSQMAEAYATIHGGDDIKVFSAGSHPGGRVNPRAVEFMKEIGYDLSLHSSVSTHELQVKKFDYVISMGCGDDCPFVESNHFEDWQVVDPKHLPDDDFRTVRNYIEIKVKDLFKRIADNQ